MMDYLRCNKCGIQRNSNNTIKLYCGVCAHVLCNECTSLSPTCPLDNRSYNGVEIGKSMPQKMQVYFEDPNKLLVLWQKVIRFQCEQRSLSESLQWSANNQDIRKLKAEIDLLNKYKTTTLKTIEKDTKCINKMKAYFMSLAENNPDTTASTSGASLNISSFLEESGVNLDFDGFNRSR